MKTINKKDIEKIISDCIEKQMDYVNEHKEIIEILKPLEGKPINGQTLNAKRRGKFRLENRYGMYYLNGKYSHLIGYEDTHENIIQIKEGNGHRGFEYLDACHGSAALKRIEQIKSKDINLIVETFNKLVEATNKMRDALNLIESNKFDSFYFSPYHVIMKEVFGENKRISTPDIVDFFTRG